MTDQDVVAEFNRLHRVRVVESLNADIDRALATNDTAEAARLVEARHLYRTDPCTHPFCFSTRHPEFRYRHTTGCGAARG